MMGRFNPMAPASGSNSHNHPSPVPAHAEKEKPKDNMSFSSIASMATMGKSMTKSLGAGLHTVANAASLPNPLGNNSNNNAEIEKKTKQAATEKKIQIAQVLSILEDVHLQCPPSHSGIILAYTGASCAPIVHPGIRFTWFRMSGEDRVEQVDEGSTKAWYTPSVDDIGAVICAQCEDNYYQGCSRYIECGPIKADALLCSQAESAIEHGTYETHGVSVSLGLGQAPQGIHAGEVHGTDDRDSMNVSTHGFPHNHSSHADTTAQTLSTVLSKKVAFLQFDGRSTVEVDEHGIFISIPTADNTATSLLPGATDKKPLGFPGSKSKSAAKETGPASLRSKFKTPRRGLRIPASVGLKVSCAQPLSLVLTVPIKRDDEGRTDTSVDDMTSEEEERMRRFLSSSTVSIPWTYEGHNHSPEAHTVNDPNLTYDEKQEILRAAELDAVIFANTVVALAEFISQLPEGTSEICICFSCPDRLVRDSLVLSVRGLSAMPAGASRFERKAVFPWLMHTGEDSKLVAESSENEVQEAKRLLKAKEEENLTLKRERNELTVQLLESREELVGVKQKMTVMQNNAAAASKGGAGAAGDKRASGNLTGNKKDEPFSGFGGSGSNNSNGAPAVDPNVALAELGKAEAFKQLSSKIIELENKLSIATKREAELNKTREDIEARNTVLNTELNKSQKSHEDLSRKLASLQSLSEAKSQSITLLERDQEHSKGVILDQEIRLREVEVLRGKLERTEATLAETEAALAVSQADGENYRSLIGHQAGEISILKDNLAEQSRVSAEAIAHLEKELGDAIVLNHQNATEIAALLLVVEERDKLLVTLEEAEREKDRLAGEINALQQKSESQARDLKKHIKDSSNALSEFEKALVRKSEECNELYVRVNMWEKAEEDRLAQENNSISNRMLRRISSLHLPDGVLGSSEHNNNNSQGKSSLVGGASNGGSHNNGTSRPTSINTASSLLRGLGGSKSSSASSTPAKRLSGTGAKGSP